jgi:hypothetical protein
MDVSAALTLAEMKIDNISNKKPIIFFITISLIID